MTGTEEKAIFPSVTVYNKKYSSKCNLPTQIEQVQDTYLIYCSHDDKLQSISNTNQNPYVSKS